jgi:vancomycin resistance protein YoaR
MNKPMAASMAASEWKYKVEDAARCLQRAEEVKADKKLFKAAVAELKKQAEAAMKAAMIDMKGPAQ